MNLGAFAVLVHLENVRDERRDSHGDDNEDADIGVNELNGLAWRQPLVAAAMTVFLLSLAGIPPTAGFFGKFIIFREAIGQGLIGLVLVGVLNTVISVYYYLRPIVAMYATDSSTRSATTPDGAAASDLVVGGNSSAALRATRPISLGLAVAIALCAAAVIAMVVLQIAVYPLAQEAAIVQATPTLSTSAALR
jgi:NADH:ubiquinone oxidoreductase subunit 2 (subunit N)